ncbi:MAG: HAD hydrolase-like protein [Bacteroidetes bacterium]|nr:HAD hydrolase-like protein [Bacteroidota bacterium]
MKIVLFDLDGTITDSSEGIVNSIKHALSRLGFPDEPAEKIQTYIGPALHETFKKHYEIEDTAGAVAIYREYYSTKGIFENKLYEGIDEVLEMLKYQGYTLALATGKPTYYAEIILKHFEIDHYFSAVVGSNMDGSRSDKQEIIAEVFKQLKYNPEVHEATMIGDRYHDVHGAKQHNIPCIGVSYGYSEGDELIEAGAVQVIDHPMEIMVLF